ncbi:MAG: DUF3108 domain-containing protein, partial [Bradymonadaceae bacterium]
WYKAWRLSFVRKVVRPHPTGEESDGPPRLSVKTAREHAGSFWVSRDAHHLPLRITMRTDFGSGEAILIRYDRHDD